MSGPLDIGSTLKRALGGGSSSSNSHIDVSNDAYVQTTVVKNRADYNGIESVPAGMSPIVSKAKVNGKYQVIGYTSLTNEMLDTSNFSGEQTVFFKNANPATVQQWAQQRGYGQVQSDQSTGNTLYSLAPNSNVPGGGTAAASAVGGDFGAPAPAVGSDAALGSRQPGVAAASGDLRAQTQLSNSGSDVDTSKLKVTVKSSSDIFNDTPYATELGPISAQQSSIQAQVNNVFGMTPDERAQLTKKLTDAGYGPNDTQLFSLAKAYEGALIDLNRAEQTHGGTDLSITKFLDQQAAANAAAFANGGTSKTITSSNVTLTDANTAESVLASSFKTALGRKPTPQELSAFTDALHQYQKANPQSTTTTGSTATLDNRTSGNTSSVTSGGQTGAGIGQFADNYVDQTAGTEKAGDKIGGAFDLFLKTITAGAGSGA